MAAAVNTNNEDATVWPAWATGLLVIGGTVTVIVLVHLLKPKK